MSLLWRYCMKTSPSTARMPKQSQIERRSPFDDVSDEELELLEEHLSAVRAKTIKRLELVAGKELEPQDATHLDDDQLKG
jgi:hypothetical protein